MDEQAFHVQYKGANFVPLRTEHEKVLQGLQHVFNFNSWRTRWWRTFFTILIIIVLFILPINNFGNYIIIIRKRSRCDNFNIQISKWFSWYIRMSSIFIQKMQFFENILQTFEWIVIILHCCLLLLLTYVRFLETVNNGFLWYGILWWYQVFHCLKNTNLWKRFVALDCFDTKKNDFFSTMSFEALYHTLVHWLKNRRCIWRRENQVKVREVLDFRVSRGNVNQKDNLPTLSWKGWDEFSYPLFK